MTGRLRSPNPARSQWPATSLRSKPSRPLAAERSRARVLAPADLGIGWLFEHARDAVVVADAATGHIALWNPAAEVMFGYSASEALGMPVALLVPRRLRARHRTGLARYDATGHGRLVDLGGVVELPALRKSGEEITVELSLNPIDEAPPGGRYVLAIIRDVTERTRLRLESEQRLRELEALYRADDVLHRSLRLEDVLQGLVDLATDILAADKSTVLVWDASHERLVPGAARGFRPDSLARMSHALGEGITGRVALTRRPVAVADTARDQRVVHHITDPEGIRSLMHVPIHIGDEVFGVFGVNYCHVHTFTSAEVRMLEALAQRAALAIENARLHGRAQAAAVLEERQRLARELHDAVTQTLFAAGLVAETLPSVWRMHQPRGERALADLRRLTWGALAEMRTLLLELRPATLTEAPLGDLVQQLGQAAAARGDLEVSVTATGQQRLPHDVQLAVYRVAQEALNNVLKHAGASRVEVDLQVSAEAVRLSVVDNGRGFEALATPSGHLGLGIMRERAAVIGARLSIDSRPGDGARLLLVWRDPSVAGPARP